MSLTKEEYLKGLREAGVADQGQSNAPRQEQQPAGTPAAGAAAATPAAPPPQAVVPAPDGDGQPAPAPAAGGGEPAPAQGAAQAAADAGSAGGGTPAAPAAGPAHGEPFVGWNQLDEATRTALKARFDEADRKLAEQQQAAERRLAEQQETYRRELERTQSRLTPAQQTAARLQLETEQMRSRLAELERTQPAGGAKFKETLEAMRQQYPQDAALFDAVFAETETARKAAEEAKQKLERLEAGSARAEQIAILAGEHPDWRQAFRSNEFKDWQNSLDPREGEMINKLRASWKAEDASFVLTKFKADTTFQNPAFGVWFNSLEQGVQQQVNGWRRTHPMHVIGLFERDMVQASILARTMSQQSATPVATAQVPTPTPAQAAQATTPTPVPDPDPQRRSTAPVIPAGQPMSEKKRAFIEAAEFLESQTRQRQAARTAAR